MPQFWEMQHRAVEKPRRKPNRKMAIEKGNECKDPFLSFQMIRNATLDLQMLNGLQDQDRDMALLDQKKYLSHQ